jgi:hypothetical protein
MHDLTKRRSKNHLFSGAQIEPHKANRLRTDASSSEGDQARASARQQSNDLCESRSMQVRAYNLLS